MGCNLAIPTFGLAIPTKLPFSTPEPPTLPHMPELVGFVLPQAPALALALPIKLSFALPTLPVRLPIPDVHIEPGTSPDFPPIPNPPFALALPLKLLSGLPELPLPLPVPPCPFP